MLNVLLGQRELASIHAKLDAHAARARGAEVEDDDYMVVDDDELPPSSERWLSGDEGTSDMEEALDARFDQFASPPEAYEDGEDEHDDEEDDDDKENQSGELSAAVDSFRPALIL